MGSPRRTPKQYPDNTAVMARVPRNASAACVASHRHSLPSRGRLRSLPSFKRNIAASLPMAFYPFAPAPLRLNIPRACYHNVVATLDLPVQSSGEVGSSERAGCRH